jgi:hypothetical protein
LPARALSSAHAAGFERPVIGYTYTFIDVFLVELWAGHGDAVLDDQGTEHDIEIDDVEATELTGRIKENLGEPSLYRVPLGWIFVLAGVAWIVIATSRSSRQLRV